MIIKEIAEADDDIRLDRWFKRHYPALSHGALQTALRKGLVKLDGKKVEASAKVSAGQNIKMPEWELPDAPEKKTHGLTEEQAKRIQQCVIYKDRHVIAINKPAGLAVQGGTGQKESVDSMLDALMFDAKERPKLVHRLDKDTSGVLLLARNAKVAKELSEMFAARKNIKKLYYALVVGVPEVDRGEISLKLSKVEMGKHSRMSAEMVTVDEAKGQKAFTRYRVVEKLHRTGAWVELWPVTGRTHQLRVHMEAIEHPIVGDGKYGGAKAFIQGTVNISPQLHLHAHRVVIENWHGKVLDVRAPLPPHMKTSWKELGLSEKDEGRSMAEYKDL